MLAWNSTTLKSHPCALQIHFVRLCATHTDKRNTIQSTTPCVPKEQALRYTHAKTSIDKQDWLHIFHHVVPKRMTSTTRHKPTPRRPLLGRFQAFPGMMSKAPVANPTVYATRLPILVCIAISLNAMPFTTVRPRTACRTSRWRTVPGRDPI